MAIQAFHLCITRLAFHTPTPCSEPPEAIQACHLQTARVAPYTPKTPCSEPAEAMEIRVAIQASDVRAEGERVTAAFKQWVDAGQLTGMDLC